MAVQDKEIKSRFSTLYIDPVVMRRIMYYAQAADGEVSGLGTVIKDDKGRYVVNQVFLLEQESTPGDTELNPEAISKLMTDMMRKNEDPGALKFWWHSHASMGCFWSGTDDECAETLSHEFAFSLVVNKAGDKKCRLDLYDPFRITFDGVKVQELTSEDNALKELCAKEVKEKVKAPYEKYRTSYNTDDWKGHHSGHYNDYYPKKGFRSKNFVDKNSRVTLQETIVMDIERLRNISRKNDNLGGVLCKDTWREYMVETFRNICEDRYEKKAACARFGTYDVIHGLCTTNCKVKKQCQFWTKLFDETEEDAAKIVVVTGNTTQDLGLTEEDLRGMC